MLAFKLPFAQLPFRIPFHILSVSISYPIQCPASCDLKSGGLAFPDDAQVRRVAAQCLRLYDSNPDQPGHRHTQSRRFLDPQWEGLHPERGDEHETDPPLRCVMEDLSVGEITMSELVAQHITSPQGSPAIRSFLRWVAAFRLVSQPVVFDVTFFLSTRLNFKSFSLSLIIVHATATATTITDY